MFESTQYDPNFSKPLVGIAGVPKAGLFYTRKGSLELRDSAGNIASQGLYAPRPLASATYPVASGVTVSFSSTATILDANAQDVGVAGSVMDPRVRMGGGPWVLSSTFVKGQAEAYAGNTNFLAYMVYEIVTDAADVEINIGEGTGARYKVDGAEVLNGGARTMTAGSTGWRKLSFGSNQLRRITVETWRAGVFAKFRVTKTDTVLPPIAPRASRWAYLGDSYFSGAGNTTPTPMESMAYEASRRLGVEMVNLGIDGTGFLADGGLTQAGNPAYFRPRLTYDVAAAHAQAPIDVLVIGSAYNDTAADQAALRTEIDAALLVAKNLGIPKILNVGRWVSVTKPATDAASMTTNAIYKAASQAAGLPYIEPQTGNVYDGAGNVLGPTAGPWVTTTSAARLISGDNTHPNNVGHVEEGGGAFATALVLALGIPIYPSPL